MRKEWGRGGGGEGLGGLVDGASFALLPTKIVLFSLDHRGSTPMQEGVDIRAEEKKRVLEPQRECAWTNIATNEGCWHAGLSLVHEWFLSLSPPPRSRFSVRYMSLDTITWKV